MSFFPFSLPRLGICSYISLAVSNAINQIRHSLATRFPSLIHENNGAQNPNASPLTGRAIAESSLGTPPPAITGKTKDTRKPKEPEERSIDQFKALLEGYKNNNTPFKSHFLNKITSTPELLNEVCSHPVLFKKLLQQREPRVDDSVFKLVNESSENNLNIWNFLEEADGLVNQDLPEQAPLLPEPLQHVVPEVPREPKKARLPDHDRNSKEHLNNLKGRYLSGDSSVDMRKMLELMDQFGEGIVNSNIPNTAIWNSILYDANAFRMVFSRFTSDKRILNLVSNDSEKNRALFAQFNLYAAEAGDKLEEIRRAGTPLPRHKVVQEPHYIPYSNKLSPHAEHLATLGQRLEANTLKELDNNDFFMILNTPRLRIQARTNILFLCLLSNCEYSVYKKYITNVYGADKIPDEAPDRRLQRLYTLMSEDPI